MGKSIFTGDRRTALRWMSCAMATLLPGGSLRANEAGAIAGLPFVDPELRDAARHIIAMTSGFYPMGAAKLPMLRGAIATARLPERPAVPIRTAMVPVGGGMGEVKVYVLNERAGAAPRPAILHTHGGGFITGSALLEMPGLVELAQELDCIIVSVEYSLAPEATWRVSMEQNYAGLLWLHTQAAGLGVDRARIAVAGESAGGGHAALLAQTARDRGQVPLAFQCLIYPMLDDRTGSTWQPAPGLGRIGWDADANRYGWRAFLGQAAGGAGVPSRAVPARAASLAGLPPAFIGTGSIDLFAREDIAYAQRLTAEGVPTQLLVLPGAFHGFDKVMPKAWVSRQLLAARLAAYRRAFGL
ncbi:alpha/beta hydrolase [Novosphingobium sediminicola]|uniref:Acetyl esterase/lipase n=1 Tax=Novosphingobium sediminicola TaxID=563162 RepID=A0A7W6CFN7_9SPHN|nr:alpha/beta hydrolase [Novosphingobium sediminicola]MBB3955664.1 acetyl esterase/lipase [Novosphingobium sediminicola]